jgi:hypothetical protein
VIFGVLALVFAAAALYDRAHGYVSGKWFWIVVSTLFGMMAVSQLRSRDIRQPKNWNGVHKVTVYNAVRDGARLPVWVGKCPCGWQTSAWSREEVAAAANQLPHPPARQAYYAGPG